MCKQRRFQNHEVLLCIQMEKLYRMKIEWSLKQTNFIVKQQMKCIPLFQNDTQALFNTWEIGQKMQCYF